MADKGMLIRIAANIDELKKNLADGTATINTTTAAMTKLATSLDGSRLIQNAQNIVAAVNKVGGATKLTESEKARLNVTLTKAIEKYQLLGQVAPKAMLDLQTATQAVVAVPLQTFAERMDGLKTSLNSFAAGARTVGFGLTAAITAPILAVGAAAIKLGMDAVESENLVTVSFGDMKAAADEWAAGLSRSLGLNRFETEKMAGTLFNMTTSMGLTRQAAFEMSTGVVQLAADMASFRNIPMKEALDKITSGLTGEAEPLKRIGILVNEATVKTYAYTHGITKQGEALTEQEKVLARYGSILSQTANDQGDLARTIESPTNQLRLMRSRIEEATTALGVALIPMVTKAIGVISSLVPYIQSAVQLFTNLPSPVQLAAVALLGIAAAVGPLLLLLGAMASAWASLIPLYVSLAGGSAAVATGVGAIGVSSTAAAAGVGILSTAMGFLYTTMLPIAATAAAIYAAFQVGQTQKLSDAFEYLGLRLQGFSSDLAYTTIESRNALAAMGEHTKVIVTQAAAVTSQAVPAVEDYATQLAKAKAELATLTPETRKQIDAALKLGATADELSKKIGISEGALKLYQAGLTAATAASTKTAAATKALAAEVKKFEELADAASVKGWAKELERVEKIAQLDRQALHDMNLELDRQIADVKALTLAHADAAANLYLQNELDLYLLQTAALREQAKVISDINNENGLRQMARDAGVEIDELVPNVQRATQSFEELAQSFAQLAQIAGGSFGSVVQSMGTLIASISLITKGQQQMATGWQQITSDSGSAVEGLMSIAGGLAAVAAGFMQATEAGTTTQRTLSGAAAGARAGSVFGPWGTAIGAGVGALVGFFRGRAAEARDARAAADDFRMSLAGVLTEMQRVEAQTAVAQGANAAWAATAIAVRDAYLAAGLSAEDALAAVDRLWRAEQEGGDAVAAVIAEIQRIMRQVPPVARAAGDAFTQAATQGVIGFTHVQDTIRLLTTQAILSGSDSLIMAMHALETRMHEAALSGVDDFSFMMDAILKMKETIAQGIKIPVDFEVGGMPSGPNIDFSGATAVMHASSGGDAGKIADFLARNPGDNARIASALGMSQSEVSRLGFQSGTRNLDFQSFPSGGGLFPLHNTEAVIPKGSGHQLAAEIAAAMPFRGAVHDEALQHEVVQLRRTMERRDRTLPHLLATMIADAMATTPRR